MAKNSESPNRIEVTDEERAEYLAANPSAAISTKPWEFEVTSPKLTIAAYIAVVVIMAVHIFMGITVGIGYTGAAVTKLDQWGYVVLGVFLSILAYIALRRPRVRANADGVEVRNIIGTRFYPWLVIYGLSFPKKAHMARLELPEFEYVPLWAMQSADGDHVVQAISQFRDLEAKYMPKD